MHVSNLNNKAGDAKADYEYQPLQISIKLTSHNILLNKLGHHLKKMFLLQFPSLNEMLRCF